VPRKISTEEEIFGDPSDWIDTWILECTQQPVAPGYTLIWDLYESFKKFVTEQWDDVSPPNFVYFSKQKFAVLLTEKGILQAHKTSFEPTMVAGVSSLAALRRIVLK